MGYFLERAIAIQLDTCLETARQIAEQQQYNQDEQH